MIRLLPYSVHDGPWNMAADEALLLSAAEGVASLRFYGWSPATLSLGYFQSAKERLREPLVSGLPWVRRASGGATLVHDQELTYALALPAGPPWQSAEPWMVKMHDIIAAVLDGEVTRVGKNAEGGHRQVGEGYAHDELCFHHHTAADLVCQGQKIVGSAQRKHHRALLQHGSILLRRSKWAPTLPGLLELTGRGYDAQELADAIVDAFAKETEWEVQPHAWSVDERVRIESLVGEKYGTAAWNARR